MTAPTRLRDRKIFTRILNFGRESVRKIAEATGQSKDSAHRGLNALDKRNQYPESGVWETEEGYRWLCRLVFAVLLEFGIKGNQGAERISDFFKHIRLENNIGVSPTALRNMLKRMEELLARYQKEQEKQQAGTSREIVCSGDEKFFDDMMILVLVDLSSGYIVLEEEADDRGYDTWYDKAKDRLEQLGLKARHFVSDRAKALIKLALTGFDCAAGADLFHAQHDIGKWLGSAFYRRVGNVRKKTREFLEKLKSSKNGETNAVHVTRRERLPEQAGKYLHGVEKGQQDYIEAQQAVSGSVHAFSLDEGAAQSSAGVEEKLEEQAKEFERIARDHSIDDNKGSLDKFKGQIGDVASIVDVWWLWVLESLVGYGLGKEKQDWLMYTLLPVVYWYQQMQKTQNPALRKAYRKAWRKARLVLQQHPLTATVSDYEIDQWLSWADWIGGKFQRASSAVEGRNGCLSQMHHNGRGLGTRRLKALTAIHNFDLKRQDGTTAAERLYGTRFPDLFEWLVTHMGDLPLPRKARQRSEANPLILKAVAA